MKNVPQVRGIDIDSVQIEKTKGLCYARKGKIGVYYFSINGGSPDGLFYQQQLRSG